MSVEQYSPCIISSNKANWSVAQRIVAPFAPHAQLTPSMSIVVDPGYVLRGTILVEIEAQSIGVFAFTETKRIDRVVVDRVTGVASIVNGIDGSMEPPPIPQGTFPVARVKILNHTTEIYNESIIDERAFFDASEILSDKVLCRANRGGISQSGVSFSTNTKILYTSTDFNIGGAFNAENSRFAPSVPGYYRITASYSSPLVAGNSISINVQKNGVIITENNKFVGVAGVFIINVNDIVYLDGVSDWLEVFGYISAPAGTGEFYGATSDTFFSAERIIT